MNKCLLVFFAGIICSVGQLVINVSKGSEQASVYQQRIEGNMSTDSVSVQYITPAGIGVNQVVDLKTKVVITVYTVPGEQDLTDEPYQVFCFISAYSDDMIPSEAVTKLRQKHPGTVRVAEEHRGNTVQDNAVGLVISRASPLSVHIPGLCREAKSSTYSSQTELDKIQKSVKLFKPNLIFKPIPGYQAASRCDERSLEGPCQCNLSSCIWWFPCSLKFCRNPSGEGEHRCGIRTCSKCFTHRFLVESRVECLWNQP